MNESHKHNVVQKKAGTKQYILHFKSIYMKIESRQDLFAVIKISVVLALGKYWLGGHFGAS